MAAGAETRKAAPSATSAREWWILLVVALQAPSAVFPLLRDSSDEALDARQEQVLAVAYLAGIAGVLAAPVAGRLADPPDGSLLLVAAWALFAGALYGLVGLWLLGLSLYFGSRWLGGHGDYRRSRHVLALAATPLALSLILWPIRLALYGGDVFRTGGDDHGTGVLWLGYAQAAFYVWALVLLVLGVRAVHGWRLGRALAATALALVLPVLLALVNLLA